ncbi:hypothetical protein GYB22_09075 [bacterium]|nr:hypothetical protein [bacterium]
MNRIVGYIILMLTVLSIHAQSNQTLHYMRSLPQSMITNPANTPDSRFFIGIPALSSFHTEVNMAGLQLNVFEDALVEGSTPGKYDLDITKLGGVLGDRTYMQIGFNLDLLHFGFLLNKSLISFNVTEKVKFRMDIPGDLAKLIAEGNGGDNLDYAFALNAGVDLRHYREYAVGYQRSFVQDHIRVGAKLKYLYGLNVFQTKQNTLSFRTRESDYALFLRSVVELNAASSIVPFNGNDTFYADRMIYGAKNDGFGLDIGASIDLNERLTINASVIDMGFIRWKENTYNIKSRNPGAEFEFRGFDATQFFSDSISFSESFQEMGDSLIDVFALDTSRNTFTTGLLSEFYLGANFKLSKRHYVGLLFYGNFYNRKFYPASTISLNSRINDKLAFSASYTAMKQNPLNVGLGVSLNLGAFQYYFVSDNFLGYFVGDIQNVGIRTGINLTFNRTVKEDLDIRDRTPTEHIDPPGEIK